MAKVKIIGKGQCPKCDGKTEIRYIESFPFPEDEQARLIEVCQSCDFEIEKDFTSTNATTSMDHSWRQDIIKEKVAKSIQEISGIISSYATLRIRPDITSVAAALKLLYAEEFPLLYVKLKELANSPLAEVWFDSLAEIRSAIEHDRQFGKFSEGMAEWYENEARAAARSQQTKERVLDSVVELVKLVEKNKKEYKP